MTSDVELQWMQNKQKGWKLLRSVPSFLPGVWMLLLRIWNGG